MLQRLSSRPGPDGMVQSGFVLQVFDIWDDARIEAYALENAPVYFDPAHEPTHFYPFFLKREGLGIVVDIEYYRKKKPFWDGNEP
jgi:hypothetical protein